MGDSADLLNDLIPALFVGGPYFAAILLGLSLPVLIVAASKATGRLTPTTRLSILLGAVVVGTTLTVALSGRVLYSDNEYLLKPWLQVQDSRGPWGSVASQLCTVIVLCIACAELWRWATRQTHMSAEVRWLWATAMAYFVASVGISGLFGTFRNPRLNDLYGPVVLTAIALLAPGCNVQMWKAIRLALFLPVAGSLVAMALVPRLAVLTDYNSFLPGIHQRLYGLAEHANGLGIVAAAALMLELSPQVRARPSILFLACQLAVLLLSQSKTAWVAALLCILFVRWHWIRERLFAGNAWRTMAALVLVGSLTLAAGIVAIDMGSKSTQLARMIDDSGLASFTGRTVIWQTTLDEFFKSPLFGYGPSLWDVQYRSERGMLFAGQAHNQFVQTLGQAGLLGMATLLVYLAVLAQVCTRAWQRGQGLALVFLVLILVRCFSESPMRIGGVMGWDIWLHFTIFSAAASSAAFNAAARASELADRPHHKEDL